MPRIDLRQHYLNYIATLNERRFEDLPTFVADELVYNDVRITGGQYRELLEDDVRTTDLHFDVQDLVVDDGYVACRIGFDCTPREPFHGRAPTGARVVFTEHVFYRFEHDHITQVWSLLDVAALNRQLPELAVPRPGGRP